MMVKRFLILFVFSLFISSISNLYTIPQQSGSLAKIVKKKAKADTLVNLITKELMIKKSKSSIFFNDSI